MDQYSWQQENSKAKTKNKPRQTENYDDDFQDQNNNNKKPNKPIQFPKLTNSQKGSPKTNHKNNKQPQQQDDVYQNDFQQPSTKKLPQKNNDSRVKNVVNKNNSKNKKSSSSSHMKRAINEQQLMSKKPSVSLMKNNSVQIESKYLHYLKTQFPHTKDEVLKFPTQKINRLNEKLRSYIKKVNDQLTDLINQNMRLLKAGSTQNKSQQRTVQDVIKVLSQQKKNGQIYIQTIQKQSYNLNQQWHKIKNQQTQHTTQNQIQQINQKIKQYTKEITVLKFNTHQQGNKLIEEKNFAQMINELKIKLNVMKKQEEKNNEKIEKCQKNYEDLSNKTPQIQVQLQRLIQKAKAQNISFNVNPSQKKKQQKIQQLKKKLQNLRLHKDKTQSLNDTKSTIIKKDIDSLNSQLSQIQRRFSQIDIQLHSTQQSSIALIQQSKNKQLQPYIQTHLDFIYKNIKQGNPLTTINIKPSKSSKQKNTGVYGLKKYSSAANVQQGFIRTQSEAQLKPSFHINKKNNLQIKTKQKVALKLSEKKQQRVWKGQQKNNKETPKQQQQPNSSKPFIIRRSQNVSPPPQQNIKKQKQSTEINNKNMNQKQNQKSSALGPKMKFKKADSNQGNSQKKQVVISQKNSNAMKEDQKKKQEGSPKGSFKIKKAIKQKVDIPDQDLYLFPPGTVKNIKGVNQLGKQLTKNNTTNVQANQLNKQSSPNIKGPNFKLFGSKKSQAQQVKTPVQQPKQKTFLTNVQSTKNKQSLKIQNKPAEQQPGINVGGRRQVQRKIARKNQQGYAV